MDTNAPYRGISAACARGSHKACRGRVLNPYALVPEERWTACTCPCPHDRGPACEQWALDHPVAEPEKDGEDAAEAGVE